MNYPQPQNEASRLQALWDTDLLDSESETCFEDLVQLTAAALNVPTVIISLLDRDRQWFKAKVGIEGCETSRDISFCTHAICETKSLVVPNALADERFKENKLVTGPLAIRAYVGAPLVNKAGFALGALCAIDYREREFTPEQIRTLEAFARQVVAQIELRQSNRDLNCALESMEKAQFNLADENRQRLSAVQETQGLLAYTDQILASLSSILIVLDPQFRIARWNKAAENAFAIPESSAIGLKLDELKLGWSITDVLIAIREVQGTKLSLRMNDLLVHRSDDKQFIIGLTLQRISLGAEFGTLIAGADITERRRAEEHARLQESRYQELVDNSSDVIFNLDSDYQILFLNKAWESLTGYKVERSLGKSLFDFVREQDKWELARALGSFSQEVLPPIPRFCLTSKSDDFKWVEAHMQPRYSSSGVIVSFSGSLHDQTDRYQRAANEKKRKELDSFITALSTEFINLRPEELNDAVNKSFATIAAHLDLNQCLLCNFSPDGTSFQSIQAWSEDQTNESPVTSSWVDVSEIPRIFEALADGGILIIDDFEAKDNNWIKEREKARKAGYRSMVVVPLFSRGQLIGFGGFACQYPRNNWLPRDLSVLKITCDIFANAILRFRTDAEVQWLSASALAESENLLRSVVTCAPIVLLAIDSNGMVTLSEGRDLKSFGLTVDLALGANINDLYQGHPQILEHFHRAKTGETFTVEETMGSTTFETHFSPMPSATGEYAGSIAISIDVTERVKADAALRIRDRAIAASSNGVIITDPTLPGNPVIFTNAKFTEMTGYSGEEILGRNCRVLQGFETDQEGLREVREAIKEGRECRVTLRNYRKDGSMFWNELTIYPVRDEAGTLINFVGEQRDITEQIELEKQLQRAQKMESIGQLAAGIAHELNTPIQYVADNIRFLQQGHFDFMKVQIDIDYLIEECLKNPDMKDFAEAVQTTSLDVDLAYLLEESPKALEQSLEGVNRVIEIVKAMKTFSHPGTIEKVATDLNRCIESTLTVCRNEWRYVAEVETDLDTTIPLVECHPGEINQCILNLVVNAAHAIGDANKESQTLGKIRVSSTSIGDEVVIKISDTGNGIPEHARSKVFDPFFTTKQVGKGTGQGLSIVHSVIVDHHSGTIDFDTSSSGTTFIISLPTIARNTTALSA